MTSIEKYHLFDDSPEFPNNFFARLSFDRPLDRQMLTEAYHGAVARHLRGAVRAVERKGQWIWDSLDAIAPLEFYDAGPLVHEPLRIDTGHAYNAKCQFGAAGNQISIQVHHALTDGLGGMSFVRDWMWMYDNRYHGRAVAEGLPPLNDQQFLQRNRIGLANRRYWLGIWRQPLALFGAAKFMWRRFQSFPDAQKFETGQPSLPVQNFPTTESMRLERRELLALKPKLLQNRITLNDFLVATLFQTFSQRGGQGDQACWRLIIPISIRDKTDWDMPVANRTTLVQLDRLSEQAQDPWGLAQGIQFELGLIRNWMLDRAFLIAIRGMSIFNGWLRRSAANTKPRATALLTNLGKPLLRSGLPHRGRQVLVGDAVIDNIELIPPIRPHMPVTFSAMEYAGDLQIVAHLDPRFVTVAQVADFLANWRSNLKREILLQRELPHTTESLLS